MALLVLGMANVFTPPTPSSVRQQVESHKGGLPLLDAPAALAALARLAESGQSAEHIARNANEIVASAVHNHWPGPGIWDESVAPQLRENWIRYLLSRLEVAVRGETRRYYFATPERLELQDILHMGVGLCSQMAIALAVYLDDIGIPARIAGLDGHVVTEVTTEDGDLLFDPDYNVVVPMSLAEIEAAPHTVLEFYNNDERIAEIYGPTGNVLTNVDAFYPRLWWYYRITDVAVIVLPLGLIVAAAVPGGTARRRKTTAGAPEAADAGGSIS